MNFLPENYEAPKTTSLYTRFEDGETVRFRILPSGLESQNCVTGFEYFAEMPDGKLAPVRSTTRMKHPEEKHFWAFLVYNYHENAQQICTIKQRSIMEAISQYLQSEDYGDPLGYDISIKRTGKGFDTKYSVIAHPPKPFALQIEKKPVNWQNFLASEDPFADDIEKAIEQTF